MTDRAVKARLRLNRRSSHGRFGGGWNWVLGVKVSHLRKPKVTIILELVFVSVTILVRRPRQAVPNYRGEWDENIVYEEDDIVIMHDGRIAKMVRRRRESV